MDDGFSGLSGIFLIVSERRFHEVGGEGERAAGVQSPFQIKISGNLARARSYVRSNGKSGFRGPLFFYLRQSLQVNGS